MPVPVTHTTRQERSHLSRQLTCRNEVAGDYIVFCTFNILTHFNVTFVTYFVFIREMYYFTFYSWSDSWLGVQGIYFTVTLYF